MSQGRARLGALLSLLVLAAAAMQLMTGAAPANAAALHDQMTPYTGAAVPSQDFTNDRFDSEAADDFTVPAATTWSVDGIDVVGFGRNPSNFTVRFYANGASLPGGLLATRSASATGVTPAGRSDSDYALRFSAVSLPTGTYWVSVQVDSVAGDAQWYWSANTSSNGNPAVFRNPGGAMASSCTAFAPTNGCFRDDQWTNHLFRIVGTSGPTEVPTTTVVSSSPNPSAFGQATTVTAFVCANSGTATPTGAVAFAIGGSNNSNQVPVSAATAPAGPCTGKPSASAQLTTSQLAVGSHSIQAGFLPSGSFAASNASAVHQVSKGTTTSSLTSSRNPSDAGEAVTLTATFCGANDLRPTGTVSFRDEGTSLGTVTLTPSAAPACAAAHFTTATLGVGPHQLVAEFGGDSSYLAAAASVNQTVNCVGQCVQGTTSNRGLNAGPGATLFIRNATINGPVVANRARSVVICGSTINGSLTITGVTGFVLLGGDGQGDCAGNVFTSALNVNNNTGGVRIAGNRIGGTTSVTNNRASGSDVVTGGPSATIVRNNAVGGALACSGNTPVAANEGAPNNVRGSRSGECVAV